MKALVGAVKLAKAIGISRTALNNYIDAETETQPRVRARLASFYLRVRRGKVRLPEPKGRKLRLVAETKAGYEPEDMDAELKEIIPRTREPALRWVEQFAEYVRSHPDGAPPNLDALIPLFRRYAESLPPEKP